MFVACVVLCAFLALISLGIGAAQLNGVPQAIAVLDHVGAKRFAAVSGGLLLLGLLGLVVGLFWAPIGVAALRASSPIS